MNDTPTQGQQWFYDPVPPRASVLLQFMFLKLNPNKEGHGKPIEDKQLEEAITILMDGMREEDVPEPEDMGDNVIPFKGKDD